jgi:hypothetical protein
MFLEASLYGDRPSLYSELYRTYLPLEKAVWCQDFHTYVSIDDPRFILLNLNETDEDGEGEVLTELIAEPWYKFDLELPSLMKEDEFIGLSKNGHLLGLIKINPKIKKELEELDYTQKRELLKKYIGPKKLSGIDIDDINAWSIRKYGPDKHKPYHGLHLIDFYVIE